MDYSKPHPALTMSQNRARIWEKEASDEDFYTFLQELSAIYAKRKYQGRGVVDSNQLFRDYKEWRESERAKATES